MDRNLKFFCCVLLVFATADTYSNEIGNYGDINIQADKITLDEAKNELLLKTNIIISFGIFTITGNKALLSYKNNKLMVDGSPASITSEDGNINGTAKHFIISPNLSLEMLGDANLFEESNSIYAQQITYQIDPND